MFLCLLKAECLAAFNALNDDDKAILSEYSKKAG